MILRPYPRPMHGENVNWGLNYDHIIEAVAKFNATTFEEKTEYDDVLLQLHEGIITHNYNIIRIL